MLEPADRSGYPRPISLVLGTKLPGAALFVSVNTVKTRTRGIFRKLAASSRHEAVEWARADGLRE